ncbi:MAG: helix-turn-helix domain-containing protein [Bacillota bacterium]
MRSLLVDDDLPVLEVLKNTINWKSFGVYCIDTATNILNAQKIIRESNPEIIICDIEMPRGSGLDLLKWVRKNHFSSQFIFLTCHESFEFASTAIAYDTVAYVTKPFGKNVVEAAIAKAVEKVKIEKRMREYSEHSKYWLDNRVVIEQGFWRDVLFYAIAPQAEVIETEMKKRHLSLNASGGYSLILTGTNRSKMNDLSWDDGVFSYAFRNLASEVIHGEPLYHGIINYKRNDSFYNISIIRGHAEIDEIKAKCLRLVELCEEYLHCKASCYISDQVSIDKLAKVREELEEMDQNNVFANGTVMFQKESVKDDVKGQYAFDAGLFESLFLEKNKMKIAVSFKNELERLSRENKLDRSVLHSIHQDFMQVVYSILRRNEVQAHILFSDQTSQKLFKNSENSIFDMMKWATHVTEKTIDYIDEIQKTESVVEKAKKYIRNNYSKSIKREDVAASVFLAPDYLSKIFKAETGVYIKDYINECRIGKAKELLLKSNASISDIAVQSGYDNFSYFSTVFKKLTGETPFSYRKTHKS